MTDPAWTCACGKSYGARPIACECGARFGTENGTATLVQTTVTGGAIRMGVVSVGVPAEGPPSIIDMVERIHEALGEIMDRVHGERAQAVVFEAWNALRLFPDAHQHDEYQEAVSEHQQLVASGAPEADVTASHARLMAQLGRLPNR